MPWSFIVPAAVSLFAANKQAGAAKDAAAAANEQQDKALGLQTRMYEEGIARQQPYANIGMEFTNRLADMQRGGPGAGMNMLNMDPGYNFRLGEGMKALERQSAARGGLISGGALKAAQRYGQDFASTEFGNAYNRLAGLAGVGQTATGAMGNAASQFGTNAGNLMTGGAAARASGYVGGANALTSGLGQYMNYTQNQNLLNSLQGGGGNANAVINPYFATTGTGGNP